MLNGFMTLQTNIDNKFRKIWKRKIYFPHWKASKEIYNLLIPHVSRWNQLLTHIADISHVTD